MNAAIERALRQVLGMRSPPPGASVEDLVSAAVNYIIDLRAEVQTRVALERAARDELARVRGQHS